MNAKPSLSCHGRRHPTAEQRIQARILAEWARTAKIQMRSWDSPRELIR